MKLEVLGDLLLPKSLVLFSLSLYLLSFFGNILSLVWHPWEEKGKQSYVPVPSPAGALGLLDGKGLSLQTPETITWVQIPALPIHNCVNLGKFLSVSGTQSPHLKPG